MKTRTDLLNFLAEKYKLEWYLEIGVQDKSQNYDKIKCEFKVGVDPDPKANAYIQLTSDEYFESLDYNPRFDLIFIDGLHTAEQVKKDFENALQVLSPNGFIVLHDCNPLKEEHTIVPRPTPTGHWNGNVYKFAVSFKDSPHVHTVDIDNGCMVIQYKAGLKWTKVDYIAWEFFDEYRKELLHLISWDEFISLSTHV